MKIIILAFGKVKAPGLREACNYYIKNITPWVKLEEIELKPIAGGTRSEIQKWEADVVLKRIASVSKQFSKNLVFLLDEKGHQHDTKKWSSIFEKAGTDGIQNIFFCIGSRYGFSYDLKANINGTLAFGAQTISHELARVVLLEQLYRAMSIIKKHPYHEEG